MNHSIDSLSEVALGSAFVGKKSANGCDVHNFLRDNKDVIRRTGSRQQRLARMGSTRPDQRRRAPGRVDIECHRRLPCSSIRSVIALAAAVGRSPSHRPLHSPTLKRLQSAGMAPSILSAVPASSGHKNPSPSRCRGMRVDSTIQSWRLRNSLGPSRV